MKTMLYGSLRKNVGISLMTLLTIAFVISCKKSDSDIEPLPVISYKQKIISIAEDVPMFPVRPDSTGGAITDYAINPMLPKGLAINKTNGVISGTPSDTLSPTQYVVTATGPGGRATDTLTLLIGTVAFNYGTTSTYVFEKNSTELSTTPLSPVILAGTFDRFFVSPSPDSLTIYTGLKFNAQTGQITGTPNVLTSKDEVPRPLTFTITGITTANKAASTTISIIIKDRAPAFGYSFAGSFAVGTAVGNNALKPSVSTKSGTIVKYRLAPGSPALPAGLVLDSTGALTGIPGTINGTPTAAFNETVVVRALNTGGYQDVSLPLVVKTTADAPQVRYMMTLYNGNVMDTLCPGIVSGSTIYLTTTDTTTQAAGGSIPNLWLSPVITAGQPTAYAITANSTDGVNLNNTATGVLSGQPKLSVFAPTTRTVTINGATNLTFNVVNNQPFFTYNGKAGHGSRPSASNVFPFLQGQKVDVGNGTSYPGYPAAALKPSGGTGVVSYSIYPANTSTLPFVATGLTFDPATGAISGTPATNTLAQTGQSYTFWNYVIVGKKADGSFTIYQIQIKIFKNLTDWNNALLT